MPFWAQFARNIFKNFAPGEARTPDLRISLSVLTYKYDALTDCATGADFAVAEKRLACLLDYGILKSAFSSKSEFNQ